MDGTQIFRIIKIDADGLFRCLVWFIIKSAAILPPIICVPLHTMLTHYIACKTAI